MSVDLEEAWDGKTLSTCAIGEVTRPKRLSSAAVEVHEPKGFGRIRMRRVPQASGKYLLPFVSEAIAPGSLVHTDGLPIYQSLPERGYRHERSVITGSESPAHASMPAVHRVASLLKRWLLGTSPGSRPGASA